MSTRVERRRVTIITFREGGLGSARRPVVISLSEDYFKVSLLGLVLSPVRHEDGTEFRGSGGYVFLDFIDLNKREKISDLLEKFCLENAVLLGIREVRWMGFARFEIVFFPFKGRTLTNVAPWFLSTLFSLWKATNVAKNGLTHHTEEYTKRGGEWFSDQILFDHHINAIFLARS